MTKPMAAGPCSGCEFSTEPRGSANGKPRGVAITQEGDVLYSGPPTCGLNIKKVPSSQVSSSHPDLAGRISGCGGRVEETQEVPRMWPFGALGLVKQVTVERCGATDALELQQVALASQQG